MNPQIDCFAWGGMVDFQLEIVDGDSSVRVDGSIDSKAEDIFD